MQFVKLLNFIECLWKEDKYELMAFFWVRNNFCKETVFLQPI